jgi:hypothetical protein
MHSDMFKGILVHLTMWVKNSQPYALHTCETKSVPADGWAKEVWEFWVMKSPV